MGRILQEQDHPARFASLPEKRVARRSDKPKSSKPKAKALSSKAESQPFDIDRFNRLREAEREAGAQMAVAADDDQRKSARKAQQAWLDACGYRLAYER